MADLYKEKLASAFRGSLSDSSPFRHSRSSSSMTLFREPNRVSGGKILSNLSSNAREAINLQRSEEKQLTHYTPRENRLISKLGEAPDHVYVNVCVTEQRNVEGNPEAVLAKVSQVSNIPILEDPSQYYMAIIRFFANTSLIPIIVMAGYKAYQEPLQPNTLNYSVTLGFGGQFARQHVVWIPQTDAELPPLTYDSDGNRTSPNASNSQYFYLFSYVHFMSLINNAFQTAFIVAATTIVGFPAGVTAAPRLVYDAKTQLFSIYAETGYDYKGITPVDIYMNRELFEYFQNSWNSFQNGYINSAPLTHGNDVQILLTDTTTNHITSPFVGYSFEQEFSTLSLWPDAYKIVFTSGGLPIVKEYTQDSQTDQNTPLLPIVTDFIPIASTGPDIRTNVLYAPTAQYRFIDLVGTTPLYNLDFQAFWVDSANNYYPLYTPHYDCVDLKIVFVKKTRADKYT